MEKLNDIRKINFSGRSINLVMSNRGWKTLEDIGLKEEIEKAIAKYLEPGLHFSYYRKEFLKRTKSGKLKQFKSLV